MIKISIKVAINARLHDGVRACEIFPDFFKNSDFVEYWFSF